MLALRAVRPGAAVVKTTETGSGSKGCGDTNAVGNDSRSRSAKRLQDQVLHPDPMNRQSQPPPLARTLTALVVGVSLAVVVLASAAFAGYQAWSHQNWSEQRLAAMADGLARTSVLALEGGATAADLARLYHASADVHVLSVSLLDAGGAELAAYRSPAQSGADRTGGTQARILKLTRPVVLDGVPLGVLELSAEPRQQGAGVLRLLMVVAAVLLITVAVSLLAAVRAQQLIGGPILALGELLRQVVSEGDFRLRAPVQGGAETVALAGNVNRLLEQVEQREAQLGEQVASRTGELLRLNDQFRHQAYHDALTKLPNRALFDDRMNLAIAQAERNRTKVAVMFLDLDRFKNINETLGHETGDQILRTAARRLSDSVGRSGSVARLGGDEFTVLLTNLQHTDDATQVARSIVHAFRRPMLIQGHDLLVTASIGISLYPDDGEDIVSLKRNADAAMYHAKEQGRNNYQYYSEEMNRRAHSRLMLETELSRALERGELTVFYQPQVDLRENRISGLEALVRWRHPERGLILPDQFVPAAEECGLITDIDEWVLRSACPRMAEWRKSLGAPLRLSVNLSVHNLHSAELLATVRELLAEHALEPAALELEITESGIMKNPEEALSTLRRLKELGVVLAIDDFGTGYSSLSYLKRFPIDTIKIDKSFIREICTNADDAEIARAILAMARSLNLHVVAEGVETDQQLAFLRALQCPSVQGYVFSRPLAEDEVPALLADDGRLHRSVDL